MNKKDLTTYLGYEPGAEQKAEILKYMQTTGKSFLESVADFSMAPLVLRRCDGTFRLDGETMNLETFHTRWPGRKIIVVSGPCPDATEKTINN